MTTDVSAQYPLEQLTSTIIKVEQIERINYCHYGSPDNGEDWASRTELLLRENNPQSIVAALAKDLWCFSLNNEPLPILPDLEGANVLVSDGNGHFTSGYSKPNLPTNYAIFVKALKKTIYRSICESSNNMLLPYGNSCVELHSGNIIQFEPHLFEDGALCISTSIRDLNLKPLKLDRISPTFSAEHDLYLSPSGMHVYLAHDDKDKCVCPPPENANYLLQTLFTMHGVDLTKKSDLVWIKVHPQLTSLAGQNLKVAEHNSPMKDTRALAWPLDLCLIQDVFQQHKNKKTEMRTGLSQTFDAIDDFIHLKQSSSYHTPGSSDMLTITNPLSSGGGYTDQFQNYDRGSASSASNIQRYSFNERLKTSPADLPPNSAQKIGADFSAPNSNGIFASPTNISGHIFNSPNDKATVERQTMLFGSTTKDKNPKPHLNLDFTSNSIPSDSLTDKELFGEEEGEEEEDKEDLFGDSSSSSLDKLSLAQANLDAEEVTEEMFGMSDEDDTSKGNNPESTQYEYGNAENIVYRTPGKKHGMKRKYLDIPVDEITLSSTPLYKDPGAPLPIETPRDRRKSVFAPLTFNPIIENNVDNKYKNGGKFSLEPLKNEEVSKFDVSKTTISSSDEDDSDMTDEFEYLSKEDGNSDENVYDYRYPNYQNFPAVQEAIPQGLIRNDLLSGNFTGPGDNLKDPPNSIWKTIQGDSTQTDYSVVGIESPLKSPLNHFPPAPLEHLKSLAQSNTTADAGPKIEASDPADNRSQDNTEVTTVKTEIEPFTSTSLSLIFRHVPISSMPDVIVRAKQSISLDKNNPVIIQTLAEQVVFDFDMLQGLGISESCHSGVAVYSDGLIKQTMLRLFSDFKTITGEQLISKIYSMDQPLVYARKSHEVFKLRADSFHFAKYLGIKPLRGIKNLRCLLIASEPCDDYFTFISTMCQTFIELDLGFCELLKLNEKEKQGLAIVENFEKSGLLLLAALIVSYYSTNKNTGQEVPLLLILPLENNTLTELVDKTTRFEIIRKEVNSKMPNVRVLLKVVLKEFIMNPMTTIDAYSDFCYSIYNMLLPKNDKLIRIAKGFSKKIKFRTLSQDTGQNTVHYDAYIHLAYARSSDKQWVFAAFSDSYGEDTSIKAWFVGNSQPSFDNACSEIWSIALQLAAKKYGKLCLILTRLNGILPDDELMNWRRLSGRQIHLAVVCVDDNDKIILFDNNNTYPNYKTIIRNRKNGESIAQQNLEDYEIHDTKQDLHAIIFKNPLPLSNSQQRCAIKSGALVNFNISGGHKSLTKLGVNLLNCPHSNSAHLLQSILTEFRNLAALNMWYGLSTGEDTHIPWHVLAVKKMTKCLVYIKVNVNEE